VVAADQSLVVFQWIASGFVAIFLVIAKVATLKPKRIESAGEQQRPIAGVWIGDIDGQPVFIELKMVGRLVEGSYVRGNYVTSINSASYFPPKLYFEIIKPDGSELYFDGLVNVDGTEMKGRWSDFVDEYQWRMRRLRIRTEFSTRPVLQNDSRADFTDVDASVPGSPLAPLLVYCALDAMLRSFTEIVPENSVPIISTRAQAPSLPAQTSPLPAPTPSLPAQAAPEPSLSLVPSPVVQAYGRRCPNCEREWQDAFAFCLYCGYVQ
jgi:hypothetical protein